MYVHVYVLYKHFILPLIFQVKGGGTIIIVSSTNVPSPSGGLSFVERASYPWIIRLMSLDDPYYG